MRIRDDSGALIAWRAFNTVRTAADNDFTHIASGLRVFTAADDAANLGIAHRFKGQLRGRLQANRNVLDGISLVQTTDGALNEIMLLIQRGRELSVQAANGTLDSDDRQTIQTEINSIVNEIDRIADDTTFNDHRLLSPSGNAANITNVINGLRGGWLSQAEQVIQTYYGLVGDGSPLTIVLEAVGSSPAWVTGTPNGSGQLDNLEIHINLADFGSVGGPDGGSAPMYNDRKIAAALTKAILARNSNYVGLETSPDSWFMNGLANYTSGFDEQLSQDIAAYGAAAVINAINTPWVDDTIHQSSAYLAVKFLDSIGGLTGVINELKTGVTLNSAIFGTFGVTKADFESIFTASGAAFLAGLNLNDADVGGVNPGDASGVIPNGAAYSMNPLSNFILSWPTGINGDQPTQFSLQVGPNQNETLQITVPEVTSLTLGLLGVDVINRPGEAIDKFGVAVDIVSSARGHMGASEERLQHISSTNEASTEEGRRSLSRLEDLDLAQAMTHLTRQQILVSSSGAMLAQANTIRQHVMWLLNGLSSFTRTGLGQ